jgi:hypothetical protein
MTKINKIAAVLGLVLVASLGFAQVGTPLTQTTLATAQLASGAGVTQNTDTTVSLASATGIQVASNGQPVTYIYIDQEAEGILSVVPGQTTIFNVLRGQLGTKEHSHASGDMVLAEIVSPQFGGFSGSGGFQANDPPFNGACSAVLATPWVNVLTSMQWVCSTVTSTWTSYFSNPWAVDTSRLTTAVASAATLTPSGPLFEVSGTTAITAFGIPVGFNATAVGGGQFCMIPTGAFTTTATNNIAKASTAVVGQVLCETWDATQLKFVASY